MRNYNPHLEKKANKNFADSPAENARTGGNAIHPKALPEIVKSPKPAKNNFSLPHTEIFYLLFHAILATVAAARSGVDEAPTELFTPKMVTYSPPNKKPNEKDGKKPNEEDGEKPNDLFFGNGKFFAKTNLKDFEKVKTLPRGLVAALPYALIFVFSQSRKIGKSWKRNGGGHFDVLRNEFLAFANLEKSRISNALLELAVELIQSTPLAFAGKDYAPLYDDFSTIKAKKYAHGVRIEVAADNEIFGKVFYKTHTIESTVTTLSAAAFRGYVELKSAFSLGYKSTALRNFVAAAGLTYNKRTTARLARQVGDIIKEIAKIDGDFSHAWVDTPKGRNAFENTQIRFTPKPSAESSDKPALVDGGAEITAPAPAPANADAEPARVTMAVIPEGHFALIVKPEFLFTLFALINYAQGQTEATPKTEPPPAPPKTIRARTTDALPTDFVATNDEIFERDFKARLSEFLAPWARLFKKLGQTPKDTQKTRCRLLKALWRALWHFLKDFFTGKFLVSVYKRIRARLTEIFGKDGNGF